MGDFDNNLIINRNKSKKKFIDELDFYTNFNASFLGVSIIPYVIKVNANNTPIKIKYYCFMSKDNLHFGEYIKRELLKEESEKLILNILNKKLSLRYFDKIKKELFKGIKQLNSFWRKNKSKLEKLSNKELLLKYEEYLKIFISFYGLGAITFVYEEYLAKKLSNLKPKDSESILGFIDLKNKNYTSFVIKYENLLHKYANKKSESIKKKIFKEFYYIKSNYVDSEILTEKHLKKDIKNLTTKKLKSKINTKKIKYFLEKLSPEEKTILQVITKTLPIRDLRKQFNLIGQFILFRFFDEILRRTKFENKRTIFLKTLFFEFKELLEHPNELENKVKKRKNITMYYNFKKDKTEFYEGQLIKIRKQKQTNLKGIIASKGKATGKANIIIKKTDFKKFKKGDILISTNTSPETLPIIKKAAAIVTEEGGITSHSAIVSRELGIPCIVGVKNITTTLKDGDYVEVDANKGEIKRLK